MCATCAFLALQFVPNPNPIVLQTLQGAWVDPKLRAPIAPVVDSQGHSDHGLKCIIAFTIVFIQNSFFEHQGHLPSGKLTIENHTIPRYS